MDSNANAPFKTESQASDTTDLRPKFEGSRDIAKAMADLQDKPQEHFVAFYLDANYRLLERVVLGIGSNHEVVSAPRDVVREALRLNAASVAVAHTHPTGDPTPSDNDIMVTRNIFQACALFNIMLLDHVVVANDGSFQSIRGLKPKRVVSAFLGEEAGDMVEAIEKGDLPSLGINLDEDPDEIGRKVADMIRKLGGGKKKKGPAN